MLAASVTACADQTKSEHQSPDDGGQAGAGGEAAAGADASSGGGDAGSAAAAHAGAAGAAGSAGLGTGGDIAGGAGGAGGEGAPETCTDGMRNQRETDVDCGSPDCAPCGAGETCSTGGDCLTRNCSAGICSPCTFGMVEMPMATGTGSYCIDSSEVTQAEYRAFLNLLAGDTSGQPSYCAWNDSLDPATTGNDCTSSTFAPVTTPLLPVVCIDWCDARAFCVWADKRLCGRTSGGSNDFDDHQDARASQWFNACSAGDTLRFPYGESSDLAACNTSGSEPARVNDTLDCVGTSPPYSGIYNLSGNVEEWEDSCGSASGASDVCRVRGGSFNDASNADFACNADRARGRDVARADLGFRCCADLVPPEHCGDGVQNGGETEIDCGGPCAGCDPGASCTSEADCASWVCTAGQCAVPSCGDHVANGDESDVDCGGNCSGCEMGEFCNSSNDCSGSASCSSSSGRCIPL